MMAADEKSARSKWEGAPEPNLVGLSEGFGTLTPLRSGVLPVIQAEPVPITAYAIMDRLQPLLGRPVAPPTVDRSLVYLCATGLVCRIASRNAYLARVDPAAPPGGAIFVCAQCKSAEEVDGRTLVGPLNRSAVRLGFGIESRFIEIEGTCARCLAAGSTRDRSTLCETLAP